ncbi:MAG: hypothetical protein Tsb0015_11380 [Simkaniaceae bacterium]
MGNKLKNLLIGLFVIIACSAIVGLILFVEPSVGDGKQTLIARFANINGISIGTRVMFAGNPVGEVVAIKAIPNARELPMNDEGDVYFYELILHVDSSVQVYNTDEITVQTSGLLGEKSIAIIPKAPPKGVKQILVNDNTPFYAESYDPLESAINELSAIADKVEEGLDLAISWLSQNSETISSVLRSFDQAMSQVAQFVSTANEIRIIESLDLATENFTATVNEVHRIIDQMKQEGAFTHLTQSIANIKNSTDNIHFVTKDLAEGRGTLGKLLNNEDFYLQVNAILSKVDTLMNDVNHYGLMFNLNKHWQRERVRRVSYMNALSTPQDFRNYFQKEVDSINMSMSRLSMLIEKAENGNDGRKILQSPFFKKDFAELYRNVNELSDNLRLYNERLLEAQKQLADEL